MRAGNLEVIYLDGDEGEDVFHERGAVAATCAARQLDTDEELSSGHRGNGNVIVVPDHTPSRRSPSRSVATRIVVSRISRSNAAPRH
jgi:hypothetical protein